MAIYHLSVKTVSRSTGRSAPAAAAYRTGTRLVNGRDGVTHDYRRRAGIVGHTIVAPIGCDWAKDRAALWNAAEAAEHRKNSTVAREYEVALPAELSAQGRSDLARAFAAALVQRYGVAADVAIHTPGGEGDQRNHHAHIMTTTRTVGPDGALGQKTRILDDQRSGEIERVRELWAGLTNAAMERAGVVERVSHLSHAARSLDQAPAIHLGPAATAMEKRLKNSSDRGDELRFRVALTEEARAAVAEMQEAEKDMCRVADILKKMRAEKRKNEVINVIFPDQSQKNDVNDTVFPESSKNPFVGGPIFSPASEKDDGGKLIFSGEVQRLEVILTSAAEAERTAKSASKAMARAFHAAQEAVNQAQEALDALGWLRWSARRAARARLAGALADAEQKASAANSAQEERRAATAARIKALGEIEKAQEAEISKFWAAEEEAKRASAPPVKPVPPLPTAEEFFRTVTGMSWAVFRATRPHVPPPPPPHYNEDLAEWWERIAPWRRRHLIPRLGPDDAPDGPGPAPKGPAP